MRLVRRLLRGVDHFFFEPIDARVYAAVRIAYAVTSLGVVIDMWPVRDILLGGDGIIVRPSWLPFYLPLRWITSERGVSALMLFVAICAIFTAIGFLTRPCLLVLYLWAFSYSAAALPAEAGYDALVRVCGLALLVSPAARRYTVDAVLFGRGPAKVPRYALRLLQWQLLIVYVVTVWLKVPDPYWRSGELMSYFLMSIFSRVASPVWAQWGRMSALLTWGSLLLEASIPALLISKRGRRLGFAGGLALHGGIAIASIAGMFSLCMIPFFAAFLKTEDFDLVQRLGVRIREMASRARTASFEKPLG